MTICKSILHSYKHLDSQIRQKHIRLEAARVQNGCMSRDNHRNGSDSDREVVV